LSFLVTKGSYSSQDVYSSAHKLPFNSKMSLRNIMTKEKLNFYQSHY